MLKAGSDNSVLDSALAIQDKNMRKGTNRMLAKKGLHDSAQK
jgi:hypothetical protein